MFRYISLSALMLLPVGIASAQDNNREGERYDAPAFTTNSQVTGPAERFGDIRTLSISSDAAFTVQHQSISDVDGGTTTIQLAPAVDYFVMQGLSIGGFIGFDYIRADDSDATRFSIGPRVGYNFVLSDMVSIWPKAGIAIAYTAADFETLGGQDESDSTSVALQLFAPFVLHPVQHFFVGLGPFLDTDLSGDSRSTVFGLKLTTGGWLLL